jgi:hypothetical protein
MIRLKANSKVWEALKDVVPKTSKAEQYLSKYVQNLEREINDKIFQTRPAWMVSKKQYWASLTTIQEGGGQIWSLGNKRVHRWLADNGLSLVKQINEGQANNITGEIAIIKLTGLVEVQDDDDLEVLQAMDDVQLDQYLRSVPANEISNYQQLLDPCTQLSAKQQASDYDLLRVNTASTIDYIKRLVRSRVQNKDRTEYRKALRILRIAQINNDVYPQRKQVSVFGRTYYEGVSIQSVNKDLRKVILSGCYEYDVKSSVVAWKLSFAYEQLLSEKNPKFFDETYWAIYYYLTWKKEFFDDLQNRVFDGSCDWSPNKQKDKIKEAITALSFGAKLAAVTWKNKHGKDKSSSLVDIFSDKSSKYEDERKRFMAATEVVEFKKQQSKLDKFIINKFVAKYPFLSSMKELKTKTGRRANSKVLAWLYQQAETKVMDIVRAELKKLNVPVRANIHDAIVVDRQLTKAELSRIEQVIHHAPTNLSYFALGETHYQ